MLRKCDGRDPWLWKPDPDNEGGYLPCDCGLAFNDIVRSTIYPHHPIGGTDVIHQVRADADRRYVTNEPANGPTYNPHRRNR